MLNSFQSFWLRAAAARVLQLIDQAERYPEGAGVRLHVARPTDIPTVKRLAEIKLRN
jgi:hypothetical protein